MKLIVGLGNIGAQYARTRHNVGFMVVDVLAQQLGSNWKLESKLKAEVATAELGGEKLILAKPQTMMNHSGESVQRLVQFYKLQPADVWVVFDDVDVPFGRLRLRTGGSSSGHQGIRSIIEHIGPNFGRIRFGISLNDRLVEPSEVYVLKPFDADEQAQLPILITNAATIIQDQTGSEQLPDATIALG